MNTYTTKSSYFLLCTLFLLLAVSCNNNSYSKQLKAEKKLIAAYIERNNINIIESEPEDGVWGEKDYLEIDDYLYFHLVSRGDTTHEIQVRDEVLLRYKRYTLDENADTLSCWTTNEAASPVQFQYGVTSSSACSGWQEAVKYMKYHKSEAKIICPSKLGFTDEQSSVTPYGYDLFIMKKQY